MPLMQVIANEAVMSLIVLIIRCSLRCSPLRRKATDFQTNNTQSDLHRARNVNVSPAVVYSSTGFIYHYQIFGSNIPAGSLSLETATIFNTQFSITNIYPHLAAISNDHG